MEFQTFSKRFILVLVMCMWLCECIYVHVSVGVRGVQKGVLNPLELDLLGTGLGSLQEHHTPLTAEPSLQSFEHIKAVFIASEVHRICFLSVFTVVSLRFACIEWNTN